MVDLGLTLEFLELVPCRLARRFLREPVVDDALDVARAGFPIETGDYFSASCSVSLTIASR